MKRILKIHAGPAKLPGISSQSRLIYNLFVYKLKDYEKSKDKRKKHKIRRGVIHKCCISLLLFNSYSNKLMEKAFVTHPE